MELTVNRISPLRKFWDPTLIFTGTSIMTLNPETGEATGTPWLCVSLPGRATIRRLSWKVLVCMALPLGHLTLAELSLSCCRQIQVTCGHLVGSGMPLPANSERVRACNAGYPGVPAPANPVLAVLASAAIVKCSQPLQGCDQKSEIFEFGGCAAPAEPAGFPDAAARSGESTLHHPEEKGRLRG